MKLNNKLAALDHIYEIYDNFVSGLDLACKKYCHACCTTGVTLTTIEGYKIIQQLTSEADGGWIAKIEQASKQPHFQLKITTNQFANMCAEGITPPEKQMDRQDPCPFLTAARCPIYAVRPFGCRCLVSRHDCGQHGYADIDEFVLSLNTVMLQAIEHMDAAGCTGNLLDMLGVMAVKENRQAYAEHKLECSSKRLIANQQLKVLMIPPEHRTRMKPILQSLREIRF